MSSAKGNVKNPAKKNPEPKEILRPGDVVRMTAQTLRDPGLGKMSPRLLVAIGWPNEFEVAEVFEGKHGEGPCVTFDCCCVRMKTRGGKFRCGGHPMGYFEKVVMGETKRPMGPGDGKMSITIPFIGELVGYEYRSDEKKAVFRVGGQEMTAEGALADLLNGVVKKHGVV